MNERLQELLDAVQRTASQVGGSAADAAYGYGLVCSAVYPLVGLLDGAFRFRRRSIDVRCDFDAETTSVDFLAQFNIRLWPILRALIYVIRENVKRTLDRESREGRNT